MVSQTSSETHVQTNDNVRFLTIDRLSIVDSAAVLSTNVFSLVKHTDIPFTRTLCSSTTNT